MLKSGENGLIGPVSNNYGKDEIIDSNLSIQRRHRLDLCDNVELGITNLIYSVEEKGADPLLTKCVDLLLQARGAYSDYVDCKKD